MNLFWSSAEDFRAHNRKSFIQPFEKVNDKILLMVLQRSYKGCEGSVEVGIDIALESSQLVNLAKSKCYTGGISEHMKSLIADIRGFSSGATPFTYLGIPLFKGKPRVIHLQPIADHKIRLKMAR
ncbi:hypothetical protein HKD37_13G036788 [Glycine soja]